MQRVSVVSWTGGVVGVVLSLVLPVPTGIAQEPSPPKTVTYVFDDGVSPQDQAYIRDGVHMAGAYSGVR